MLPIAFRHDIVGVQNLAYHLDLARAAALRFGPRRAVIVDMVVFVAMMGSRMV